jgi:hypothetical protein
MVLQIVRVEIRLWSITAWLRSAVEAVGAVFPLVHNGITHGT